MKTNRKLTAAEVRNHCKISYNYCGICGRSPNSNEEPNWAPIRWWDCDDGWRVGTLCRWCHDEVHGVQPKPGDYALHITNGVVDECNSDEDISALLF